MLATMHTPDPLVDCCTYQVKKYATVTKEGVGALIALNSELPYTSRGLYFWPHVSKHKPKLVNFYDNLIKSVVRKVKDVPDFRELVPQGDSAETVVAVTETAPIVAVTPSQEQVATWMRKTELPDVYDVFADGGGGGKGEKLGTAYIPNMKVSKMMRAIFRDTTVAVTIKIIAMYQKAHDKWLPICQTA